MTSPKDVSRSRTYSVLVIPPQDYLRHPHPTRLHHIFERFENPFQVTILNMRIRTSPKIRGSRHEVIEVGHAARSMLLSYLLGYADFHLQLVNLIRKRNYDCMILSSIISPIVPLLASGRPVIFDYKDIYSLSASAPFSFPVRTFVYWVVRFFEEILLKFRMTVVVPSPSLQGIMRRKFGINAEIITNGVDTHVFKPLSEQEKKSVREKLGIQQSDFCLSYLGSIENWLDLETVLCALEQVPHAKLVLIGGAVRSSEYLQSILSLSERKRLTKRVLPTGFRTQHDAAEIVGASDGAIIPFRTDTELSQVALPDKLFEYLAAGVPVISTRLPSVVRIFGNSIHFYDTVNELSQTIRNLIVEKDQSCCDVSRSTPAENYDWGLIASKYQCFLKKIVETGRRPQTRSDGSDRC